MNVRAPLELGKHGIRSGGSWSLPAIMDRSA
jgi:hypothetical protein